MNTVSLTFDDHDIIPMLKWLIVNVGEYIKSNTFTNHYGIGWSIYLKFDSTPLIWHATFDNNEDALLFRLTWE